MTITDAIAPLVGGALIGLASAVLLLFHGRVAGISGIFDGVVRPRDRPSLKWKVPFIAGLMIGGLAMNSIDPTLFAVTIERSPWALIIAGLLVGYGTRLGGGCTSGHGVCGISRVSPRSLTATATFIAVGMAMAAVITQVLGGVL